MVLGLGLRYKGGVIMSAFIEPFRQICAWVIRLLPSSPFTKFLELMYAIPYLKVLNWFFPITEAVTVFEAFLAVLAVYYIYKPMMRYIKLVF